MKADFLVENIEKPLSLISKIIPSFAQVPVLSNILIDVSNEGMFLCATDLELGVKIKIPAKIDSEGSTTVPGKLFLEAIASLAKDKVTIKHEKDSLHLSSRGNNVSFQTIGKEEFPSIFDKKGKKIASFTEEEFKEIFSKLTFAASADETRPVLTGILIAQREDGLETVATDGYRLSYKRIPKKIFEEIGNMILSARLIEEASLLKPENGEKIEMFIYKEGSQVIFETKDTMLVGRTIEGEFPKYEKVIPKASKTTISFDKEEFLQAVRLSSVFAKDNANIIKLKAAGGSLFLSARSQGLGEGEAKIDIEQEGEDNEVAFNAKFLTDFLKSVSSKKISLSINSPVESGLFKQEGDESYLHVIMPVRVQE